MSIPESYSGFYKTEKLGFDLKLVEKGFYTFKPFFTGKSCLELGPATGYMTKHLQGCFEKLTAVEGSKTLIDQIPDYPNLHKVYCLFEAFVPNEQFDTIVINHVLEHLEDPIALLKNARNWMMDHGVCIVGVPNAKSFHRLAAVHMGLLKSEYELNSRDLELGHLRVYDLDTLKKHVLEAGFIIKAEGGLFLKFLSNAQIEKNLEDDVVEAYFSIAKEFYVNSAEIFLILEK